MPKVTIFNFYDYLKNPMALYCVNQYKDKQILTLDDVKPYIDRCSHSKHCIERCDSKSYIGDQVRLLMGSEIDDFCYVDADCIINNLDKIKKDTIAVDCSSDGTFRLQNGTFFYGLKDFNKYYYEVYEKNWHDLIYKKGHSLVNYEVFLDYPPTQDFSMNALECYNKEHNWGRHFYISMFNRYKRCTEDRRVVYYTLDNKPRKSKEEKIYWQLSDCPSENGSFMNRVWYFETYNNPELVELWKAQVSYTLGNPFIKFVEI